MGLSIGWIYAGRGRGWLFLIFLLYQGQGWPQDHLYLSRTLEQGWCLLSRGTWTRAVWLKDSQSSTSVSPVWSFCLGSLSTSCVQPWKMLFLYRHNNLKMLFVKNVQRKFCFAVFWNLKETAIKLFSTILSLDFFLIYIYFFLNLRNLPVLIPGDKIFTFFFPKISGWE